MAKIITNIPELDNLLKGGIDKGSFTCLWAKPGLNGAAFSYQIAANVSKTNKVFYVINSKSVDNAKQEMKVFGFNPSKVIFVDSYSALVGSKPTTNLLVHYPKNPDELIKDVSVITKKFPDSVIILDSLSTLIDLTEKQEAAFLEDLKKLNTTFICLFTEWGYKPEFVKKIRGIFDNIVSIRAVEEKLFFRQYFGVTKLLGSSISEKHAIPFSILKPGGIKIYIPKILVTGPFNAGKSSFIHSVSERAVSVDRLGTTIALDHGHVKYKDFAVDLFGTPGQQRFDPILKLLGGEAFGVIVIVSAVDPQGYPRALEMLKIAQVYGLPVVFAANKADLRGALSPKQVKVRMNLKDYDVIPITAKNLSKVQPGVPCQLKQRDIEKILERLFSKLFRVE
jgi:uncharacterized protein